MCPSLLCSIAPSAPSTATCFRGPLCPYFAAGRCMFSHVLFQAPCYADSPNAYAATGVEPLFPSTCTVASPECFRFPTTAAFAQQEDSNSHVQLRNNEHLDVLHTCAAAEVESLFPSTCTDVSTEYHQSSRSTSFTQQAENTVGLPLRINMLPAQSRTSSGSRPTHDKDSQLDSRPQKTFRTRAICFTSELASLWLQATGHAPKEQNLSPTPLNKRPDSTQTQHWYQQQRPYGQRLCSSLPWSILVDECEQCQPDGVTDEDSESSQCQLEQHMGDFDHTTGRNDQERFKSPPQSGPGWRAVRLNSTMSAADQRKETSILSRTWFC